MTQATKAFRMALDAHNTDMGLANETVTTEVWHMLRSMLEFCDAGSIDFDNLLEEAREDIRDNG